MVGLDRGEGLQVAVQAQLDDFALEADLAVPPGVTALIGASGAGKSSLADMIAGLRRPDSGRLALDGRVLFDSADAVDLPPERRRIGYVFQRPTLFPHLSVLKNLRYGARPGRFGLPELSALLDLRQLLQRRPQHLSGGEARRVAIARSLLAQPAALVLDEPTAGLDPSRRAALLAYLERLVAEIELPLLIISHQLDDVLQIAGRAALMEQGRILAEGDLARVLLTPAFRRFLGVAHRGSVLEASAGPAENGLTTLHVAGATLYSTRPAPIGRNVRLFVLARDVALSLDRPEKSSILNVLPVRVIDLAGEEDGQMLVRLELTQAPGTILLSSVSRQSAAALDLRPGFMVFALVKAVAVSASS